MCEREMIRFSYDGVTGCVYGGVWVRWAGMGFQIEAAGRQQDQGGAEQVLHRSAPHLCRCPAHDGVVSENGPQSTLSRTTPAPADAWPAAAQRWKDGLETSGQHQPPSSAPT